MCCPAGAATGTARTGQPPWNAACCDSAHQGLSHLLSASLSSSIDHLRPRFRPCFRCRCLFAGDVQDLLWRRDARRRRRYWQV
ncbi:hypothetical protein NDU88_003915 [Pleurodeles waltl]|uniref:Uncharacterized protein n=1 Tax=Pleurodeles waltl TaxID=8319 RepID=A0AAV7V3V2_PLEWA|nr:hypothetical protein NDU88_003915 [Pleurodeles waltl]